MTEPAVDPLLAVERGVPDSWIRLRRPYIIAVSVLVVAVIALTVVLTGVVIKLGQVNTLSNRNDCKTEYNSLLNEAVQRRDDLGVTAGVLNDSLSIQLGQALLAAQNGGRAGPEAVATYQQTVEKLGAVNVAWSVAANQVAHQPLLDDASAHGFTLNGKKYPPCPSL